MAQKIMYGIMFLVIAAAFLFISYMKNQNRDAFRDATFSDVITHLVPERGKPTRMRIVTANYNGHYIVVDKNEASHIQVGDSIFKRPNAYFMDIVSQKDGSKTIVHLLKTK